MAEGNAQRGNPPHKQRATPHFQRSGVLMIERLLGAAVVLCGLYASVRLHGLGFDTQYALLGVVACLCWLLAFNAQAASQRRWRVGRNGELSTLLAAWGVTVVVLMCLGYALKITAEFSRLALSFWIIETPILLWLLHFVNRVYLDYRRRRGVDLRRAVLAPGAPLGLRLAQELESNPQFGIEIDGYFDDRTQIRVGDTPLPRLGDLGRLVSYVRAAAVDLVYLVVDQTLTPQLQEIMRALEGGPAAVVLIPDLFAFYVLDARLESLNGIPLLAVGDAEMTWVGGMAKRAMDLILAGSALLLASPLLLAVALAIKLDSSGPVLFRQHRYGLNGDQICVYKFRSMFCQENGAQVTQARRADPRVTRVGALLRRFSLDEIPQLLNVLNGSMSLVGPRPHAVAHNEFYRDKISGYMLRHKVRPGLTGWAQINGCRGETATLDKMQKRLDYDLDYIRHWSPWLDAAILLKTIPKLFQIDEVY